MINLHQAGGLVEMIDMKLLIPIDVAGFKDGKLAKRTIDHDHVKRLAVVNENELPPIETVKITDEKGKLYYVIIDGNHRYFAALTRNNNHINGIARTYRNENEVIEAAFRANLSHGKAASNQTRSSYARWLHKLNPNMGVNDIARQVGLDKSVVSRLLSKEKNTESNANNYIARNLVETCIRAISKLPCDENTTYKEDCRIYAQGILDYMQDTYSGELRDDAINCITQLKDVLNLIHFN